MSVPSARRRQPGRAVVARQPTAYPWRVPRLDRQLSTFLRASLLVLLVLGIVVKPVLAQVGELHAMEHASLADADGHGHDHGGDHDSDQDDDQGDEPGSGHAQGAHGLMHQGCAGSASTEAPMSLALPALATHGTALPPTGYAALPPAHFGTPFRPPIA